MEYADGSGQIDPGNGRAAFVVTVDTEADDAWRRPTELALKNVAELPRFQELCERFGARPTYLVTYECATREECVSVLAPLAAAGRCEIGHHLHVWSCPPFAREEPRGIDAEWLRAYQSELPDSLFAEKADCLHESIVNAYGVRPVSHRAGRWGLDRRTIDWLIRRGYRVDTSVTPLVSWRKAKGRSEPGPSFMRMPHRPFTWPVEDGSPPGADPLVEIPVTASARGSLARAAYVRWADSPRIRGSVPMRLLRRRVQPRLFRPDPSYPPDYFRHCVEHVHADGSQVLNLMLHSSELAYDCSPFGRNSDDLERVWERLRVILETVHAFGLRCRTLSGAAAELGQVPPPGVTLPPSLAGRVSV